MKHATINATIALGLGLALTLAGVWLLGGGPAPVYAQGPDGYSTYYVAPSCSGVPVPCYTTVQAAVDAADDPDDVIKVAAGTYTSVNNYGGLAQVVYISKTVTVRGGYTTTNWATPDPEANPTTLDAQGQGRVFYITGDPSAGSEQAISPTIEGLRITGGDATGLGGYRGAGVDAGGGVYVISATPAISSNWIFGNNAVEGGGLLAYNSAATLSDNSVISNTAIVGGGLALEYATAMLKGNRVISNTSMATGGGLNVASSAATLNDNTVISNTSMYGGGLNLDYSDDLILNGNIIIGNVAQEDGGGLMMYDGSAVLVNNLVADNWAIHKAGGLYFISATITLSRNQVFSNTTTVMGGGLLISYYSTATLNSNTVASNTAKFAGGGLLLDQSTATLISNTFTANATGVSDDGGGGLCIAASDAALISNTIVHNTADVGGGLELIWSDAALINNLVADNQAISHGSGLYIRNSSPRLLHTTIARNTGGDGSGVYVAAFGITPSIVALTNTILVSHTVGITVVAGSTATLEATLWGDGAWANGADRGGAGTILTGTHNYWGDPAFVDPNAGDYHIGSGSAAIDVGVDAGVTEDMDGEPRPAGSGYDLGADEFLATAGSEYSIYLPVVLRQSP
jgi:hypothetical protein